MERAEPGQATRLLIDAGNGDREAAAALLPLVYDELRLLARQRMAGERASHTLQATALVHEAYLRLVGDRRLDWANRAHFYAAAAEAMRRILLDHARGRRCVKRGSGRRHAPLSVVDLAVDSDPEEVMSLDEAISRLEEEDRELGQVVRLRFYAGLSVDDTAAALGVAGRTVKRKWAFARAWLYAALSE